MHRELGVIIIVLLRLIPCGAQCSKGDQIMLQQITASAFNNYYTQYEGSPFFNEKWYDASVKLTHGEICKGLKVKVDIYKDELIYDNIALNKILIIDNFIIDEIYLYDKNGNQEYLIKNVFDKGSETAFNGSFYFVHVSDSISLWSKNKKVRYLNNSTSAKNVAYFAIDTKYYIVVNGELISVRINKKAIAKQFPENKKSIISCINESYLNLKDARHLNFLFRRINEFEKLKPSNKD